MQKTLFLFTCMFCSMILFAQTESTVSKIPGRTSFYAEVGGPGILFSTNFDSRFAKSSLGWGGRIGLGFVTADEETEVNGNYSYDLVSVVTIPVQVNYIFGKTESPHTFEVGAGVTYVGKKLDIFDSFSRNKRTNLFGTAAFMYRRQPLNGGFTWRIGFTPLIANGYVQASGAVGVGYSF